MPKQPIRRSLWFLNNKRITRGRPLSKEPAFAPTTTKSPTARKDKAEDPLGVCSLFEDDEPTIVCPIRFRRGLDYNGPMREVFSFRQRCQMDPRFTEVRLNDKNGKSAGNIDVVWFL